MSENCLFCLESNAQTIRKSACPCIVRAHESCWESYEMRKGIIECPICHLKTELSPLSIAMNRNLREKVILELPRARDDDEGFQKCLLCCCLGYFFTCGILGAVFG